MSRPFKDRHGGTGALNSAHGAARSVPSSDPSPTRSVASEHWCFQVVSQIRIWTCSSSGGIRQLIVIGMIAHTCIEATVRFAAELGYDVTVVKDATGRDDARRARHQYPELCECRCEHGRGRCLYLFCLKLLRGWAAKRDSNIALSGSAIQLIGEIADQKPGMASRQRFAFLGGAA